MTRRCVFSVFIALYVIISLFTLNVYIRDSNYGLDNGWAGVPARPFAYRVLIPGAIEATRAIIPEEARGLIRHGLITLRDSNFGRGVLMWNYSRLDLGSDKHLFSDRNIFFAGLIMFIVGLSLFAFIGMFYKLAKTLFPDSLAYALIAPLPMLLLLPIFEERFKFVYDFAELFFSCALFYLMYEKRWRMYLFCLVVGTLNKDTTIFSIFFFLIWFFPRLPKGQYLALAAAQIALFTIVKGSLMLYFVNTPGIDMGDYWMANIVYLYGYTYTDMICLSFTVALLTYQWPLKPAYLRAGLWMLLANAAAYFMTCNPGEYRDLYYAMPMMVLLATHTLVKWAGVEHLPVFLPAPIKLAPIKKAPIA